MKIFDQDDARDEEFGTTVTVDDADDSDLYWDDEEFVTMRPAWFRVGRGLVLLGVLVFAGYIAYSGARGWFDGQLDPEGEPGEAVAFNVPSGATTSDIARRLEANDIIPNSTFFRYYAQWTGEGNFQAGDYEIPLNSSVQEAIEVLNEGPKPQVFARFTVQEGLWIEEILPLIADQLVNVTEADLRRVLDTNQITPRYRPNDQPSWEGLLFPDTYEVNEEADAYDVLLKMSDEFASVTGEIGFGAAETSLGYSAYEVLIVASLVEAETRVPEERPLVASVIYNRLRDKWALGIDATCIYGAGDRQVQLTTEFLNTPGPYNCRQSTVLPPTPINAPSRSSLEAAIRPPETEYMYYVLTDPSGAHSFAETEEEFFEFKQICIDLGLGCG